MAGRNPSRKTLLLLSAVLLSGSGLASSQAQAPSANRNAATQALLEKARSLESRGRMDMAAQTWQQVLLADPNNTDALGGLARSAKMANNQSLANTYLQRLKAINPNDPGIARAESVVAQGAQLSQLQQAGKLAAAGNYAEAMKIYRQVFGSNPPQGEWSLAYYQTEAATEDGRAHAIAGLRSMVDKYPQDSRYQVALGRILTYNPKTRPEGRRLLERYPNDAQATEALKQSLVWDAQNPASAAEIRSYLQKHRDPQLQEALRNSEAAQSERAAAARRSSAAGAGGYGSGSVDDPAATLATRQHNAEENAAYAALNAKRFTEAEERFKSLLAKDPNDARALAGMGYVRMNQQNFGGAISFLEQARQDGATDKGLDVNLATARYFFLIQEGGTALNENDLTTAEQDYRQALILRSNGTEALLGLAGTLAKAQQPEAAAPYYAAYVKLKPASIDGWRGLFMVESQGGNAQRALETERSLPVNIRAQLMGDPEFLRTLASAYTAAGRDADAQRVLRSALDLPFPAGAQGVKADTQLQYASLLLQANHMDQAEGLYRQVLSTDPSNTLAWEGLVNAQHITHNDTAALATLESMPPEVYEQALREPGFLGTAAAIYSSQNKYDIAQSLLERAIARENTTGQKVPVPLQLQLAGLYLQRNDAAHAFPIYQRILGDSPDRVEAWKGLLGALHIANRDRDALAQIQQIPPATRKTLESDVDYLQTVGNIYNGLGQPQQAMVFLNRVQQRYIAQHATPPADIDIQNAYLLFNGGNDTGLYRQLLVLGSRPDLGDEQRRTVQTIWALWAVRRSNQSAAAGNDKRALAILNATARAFPDNPAVVKALASGYLRAGLPKQAVAIFKSQDMTTASAADYKAAVGAALAANDMKDAEGWLRYGLNQYSRDSQLLALAAKFEQARGDSSRAADYYKASLAALPLADPGSELAYILNQPVAALNPRALPSPTSAQDLAQLLAPGQEDRNADGTRMTQPPARPYLPSMTNSYGQAPVQLGAGTPLPGAAGEGGGYRLPASTAPAVPEYMANPNSTVRNTPTTQRLRDYKPVDPSTTPAGGYVIYPGISQNYAPPAVLGQAPSGALNAGGSPALPRPSSPLSAERDLPPMDVASNQQQESYLAYQQEQVRRSVQQAQIADDATFLPRGPHREGAQTAEFNGEVYGPYVPYMAPSQANATPMITYSASDVNSTTLRNGTSGSGSTMKNARNTRVVPRSSTSIHPEIAAAEAAAARRRQSDPRSMTGQSNPPEEIDNGLAQNSQYVAPGQVTRPSRIPSTALTNGGGTNPSQDHQPQNRGTSEGVGSTQTRTAGSNAYPGALQGTDTYAQQYPRPTSGMIRRPAARRPAPQRSATAVSAGGPAGAPIFYPAPPTGLTDQPYPDLPPYNGTGPVPTDEQLISRNVPPLRGHYDPNGAPAGPPLTERQQTELDLETLEASYSAWMGGSGSVRFRSGRAGVERLFDYEVPYEASIVTGRRVRFSVVPKAVFLNNGTLDLTGVDPTTAAVPVLGTLPITAVTSPSPQFASGVGGELQVVGNNFGVSVGYTPYDFLVSNIIGRARIRFFNHLTLFGERDSVKDTQLSYAGMRDPGSISPVYAGNIWGGVISTGGGARFDLGDEKSGFYLSADGGTVTGYHVLDNKKMEGTMGAYFRVLQLPGYGSMTVGGSFFGMHYSNNERPLSYGNGGYFSPNVYFLGSVPVTFNGHYKTNLHYTLSGALGIQTFEEDHAKLFPLDPVQQSGAYSGCTLTQIAQGTCTTAEVPRNTSTGANFNIGGQVSYRVAEHWYVGGALAANNTNNYTMVQPSFFARYLFRPQYTTQDYPTGLFPIDGLRPLRVP